MFKKDPITIIPYRGYQAASRLYVRGRVLEDEIVEDKEDDRFIRTLWNNFRRFETDEIPGAKLRLSYLGQTFDLITDEEGFYELDVDLTNYEIEKPQLWHHSKIELLNAPGYPEQIVQAVGEVLTPNVDSEFGVISDIDDTILQTHMTSFLKLKMLHQTFTHSAHKRMAMEGIVEVYQQLAKGADGKGQNPFFYLSDSPWNLYDTINNFIAYQELPAGPLFLRNFGFNRGEKRKLFKEHKRINIARILNAFPELPFVLLGDTASHDADYYLEAMREFPDRIKAVYIRQTKLNKNARRIHELQVESGNPDFVIVENSAEILADAKKRKLI